MVENGGEGYLDLLVGKQSKTYTPINFTNILEPKRERAWRKITTLTHMTNQPTMDLQKLVTNDNNIVNP
jgi:hypothetical protein